MSPPDPSPEHFRILRDRFGHSNFRPMQWKIIHTILAEQKDICVVMATGYGKSLCYQYPPVFKEGLGIVISPLISLMQDQILSLKMSNIEACFLGSAQDQKNEVTKNLLDGKYRLLYVTPEWCAFGKSLLASLHQKVKITVVAVDEAHCVSQWGCDFRPDYRNLGRLKEVLNDVPFIAVTATATPKVRSDICTSLKLKSPEIICTDFNRPNLYLSASIRKSAASLDSGETLDSVFEDFRELMVKEGSKYSFSGSTIIYCPSRKRTEDIAQVLLCNGIKCAYYHANLSLPKRKEIHEKFVRDELPVIVATVAFGMGIDKPDVRFVIHYGAPKEIESYYQEVGRAGRDGLPSRCHVFYKSADFSFNKHFFANLTGEYKTHRLKMARLLENFLETKKCRRRLLLSYFQTVDDENVQSNKRCCDNCTKGSSILNKFNTDSKVNLEEDAKLLLKAVRYFNGKAGLTKPIQFLRGQNTKNIKDTMKKSELYGKGQKESEVWWKALGRILLREDLLEERSCQPFGGFNKGSNSFPVSVVCITKDGEEFIKNGAEALGIRLEPTEELLKNMRMRPQKVYNPNEWQLPRPSALPSCSTSVKPDESGKESRSEYESESELKLQQDLFNALFKTRQELAFKFDIMPYIVASNETLQALCRLKPKTLESLRGIEGFNEAKIEKFGAAFIKTIDGVVSLSLTETNKSNNEPEGSKSSDGGVIESKSNFNSYFDDDDDELFENLDDTTETNFNSSIQQISLQNIPESTSPIFAYPKSAPSLNQADTLLSSSFLAEDDALLENVKTDFDCLDEPSNQSTPSKSSYSVTIKKLPRSKSPTICASLRNKYNASKKMKFSDYNSSDEDDNELDNHAKTAVTKNIPIESTANPKQGKERKLPDWMLKPDAKTKMNKISKKNTLFK